jgi:hypothetical protein
MQGLRKFRTLKDLATITKRYTINGKKYNVECNLLTDYIHVEKRNGTTVFDTHLDEYTNFEGNLEDFVTYKVVEPVEVRGGA